MKHVRHLDELTVVGVELLMYSIKGQYIKLPFSYDMRTIVHELERYCKFDEYDPPLIAPWAAYEVEE